MVLLREQKYSNFTFNDKKEWTFNRYYKYNCPINLSAWYSQIFYNECPVMTAPYLLHDISSSCVRSCVCEFVFTRTAHLLIYIYLFQVTTVVCSIILSATTSVCCTCMTKRVVSYIRTVNAIRILTLTILFQQSVTGNSWSDFFLYVFFLFISPFFSVFLIITVKPLYRYIKSHPREQAFYKYCVIVSGSLNYNQWDI